MRRGIGLKITLLLLINFSMTCSFANETAEVTASQLMEKSKEILRLRQQLDGIKKQTSKYPRQKYINGGSLSIKPPVYRDYVQNWVKKIERFADMHYPASALELEQPAKMRVDVAIKADGSVHNIRVSNNSGNKKLEQDVISLVKMAAPFAPFPEAIKQEADILHITRIWHFLSKSQMEDKKAAQETNKDK